MTQKDFELIASVLKQHRGETAHKTDVDIIAIEFAERLATTNPCFKREAFLRACGVES